MAKARQKLTGMWPVTAPSTKASTERRYKRVRVGPEFLTWLLKQKEPFTLCIIENSLPADAEFHGLLVDYVRNTMDVVVSSEQYEPVPINYEIPAAPDPVITA